MKHRIKIVLSLFLFITIPIDPATFLVINTNDSGAGSLRQAILDANADPTSPRIINFAIASGVQTITPLSTLPSVTANNVLIDGTSQPGWSVNDPQIVIDGIASPNDPVLTLDTVSSCTIAGLVLINASNSAGILIRDNIIGTAQFNSVFGCFLGIGQDGVTPQPNDYGISLGNILNTSNLIANNQIGGPAASQRNVISGNINTGILLNISTVNNSIQGNYIGVDKTGIIAVPNNRGIELNSTSPVDPVDGTIIGGSNAGEGNVIAGNNNTGIISLNNVINSIIIGNFIGTDITATLLLGNGAAGIFMTLSSQFNNRIGGTLPNEGNVIKNTQQVSSNGYGILMVGVGGNVQLNPILGNSIFNNDFSGIELQVNANNNQQPPTILSAVLCNNDSVTVIATAPAAPAASNFRLEFFNNNLNRNPITEGERFIGAIVSVPSGATVSQNFPAPGVIPGTWISATATNLNNTGGTPGDTSEFTSNTLLDTSTVTAALSSSAALICSGSSVTLTATFTGNPPFDLAWSDGFIQTVTFSPIDRLVTPTTTTDYSFIVSDSLGCSATSNTITVSLFASLNPILTTTTALICPGQSTTLNLSFTGFSPFDLAWSDGLLETVTASPVTRLVSPLITTDYSVIVTDSLGCQATSNILTVSVSPTGPATLIATPTTICSGQSSTLTVTFTGTPPFDLTWSDGFLQTVTASPVSRIVNPLVTTNYSVIITDVAGCETTSNAVTVAVSSLGVATLTATPTVICGSQSSTLTVTFTGTSPFDLTWSDGLLQTVTASPVSRIVNPLVTTNYSVIITDVTGCETTSNAVTVAVSSLGVATLTATPTIICGSQSSTLTVTFTGTSPFDLAWSDGLLQTVTASPVSRVVNPLVTTAYFVTITDATDCQTISNTFTVNVSPVGAATLIATPTLICSGQNCTLTTTFTGTPPFVLTWSDGLVQGAAGSPANRIVNPIVTTTYFVTITDANGCQSISNSITITVSPLIVSLVGIPQTICRGTSAQLILTISSGSAPYTIQWSDGTLQISAFPTVMRMVAPTTATIYSAVVTDASGCNGTSPEFCIDVIGCLTL